MGHHLEDQPIYTPPMRTPPIAPVVHQNAPGATNPPTTPISPISSNPTPQTVNSPSSNGMIWCSGPQAPGWNVSLADGGCGTQKASSTSTVVHLSQLPYTGDNGSDVEMSAAFYVLVLGLGISGIALLLKRLHF